MLVNVKVTWNFELDNPYKNAGDDLTIIEKNVTQSKEIVHSKIAKRNVNKYIFYADVESGDSLTIEAYFTNISETKISPKRIFNFIIP